MEAGFFSSFACRWEMETKSMKWREERNAWIATLTLLLYIVTFYIHYLQGELLAATAAASADTTVAVAAAATRLRVRGREQRSKEEEEEEEVSGQVVVDRGR
jgi:hypothetical protein